tara:strand:+ start:214 stop:600 length:387 start_codon:yes stop_codon:yes gene_type:complete
MKINAEISYGELFDKISILEIKKSKIKDKVKLININKELKVLLKIKSRIKKNKHALNKLKRKLTYVNIRLWNVEDKLRKLEKNKSFSKAFINLARNVYKLNDSRSKIKHSINLVSKSSIIEEKSYEKY